jgi:hypothetical protein
MHNYTVMIIIQTTRAIMVADIWTAAPFYSEMPVSGFAQCKLWCMRSKTSESQ